ncbi:hypothetical protein C8J57DRAFT_1476248 [Mycena rebaudengoi]|nr:hypothetical protein C8J57DRAFT_1476248 [Mycena rebaudengoi]
MSPTPATCRLDCHDLGLRPDIPSPPATSFLLLLCLATRSPDTLLTARPHPSTRSRLRPPTVTTRIAKPSAGSIKQKRGAHGEQRKTRGGDRHICKCRIPKPAPTQRYWCAAQRRRLGLRAGKSGARARSPRHSGRAAA